MEVAHHLKGELARTKADRVVLRILRLQLQSVIVLKDQKSALPGNEVVDISQFTDSCTELLVPKMVFA